MKKFYFLLFASALMLGISSCNKCKDVTCDNGGVCEDGLCECVAGFSGTNCEIEDKCITNDVNCQNEGVCDDGVCKCAKRYFGESCETYCQYGSYKKSTGECNCYPGYDDETCSHEMRQDWIGEYTVSSDCNGQNVQSIIVEKEHPVEDSITIAKNYISITNLTTAGDTKGYGIMMDGNKLRIPLQNVKDANGTTFSIESTSDVAYGNGTNFTLVIKRKLGNNAILCTLNFNRN